MEYFLNYFYHVDELHFDNKYSIFIIILFLYKGKIMKISNKVKNYIKKFEGLSLYPYICPADKLTIGYGHTIQKDDIILGVQGSLFLNIYSILKKFFFNRDELNANLKIIFNHGLYEHQANDLLQADITEFSNRINSLIKVPLNQNQYDAIISLAYNIGVTAFAKSRLRILINQNKFIEASLEFDRWVYVHGKKIAGLINRRSIEKKLFLEPIE